MKTKLFSLISILVLIIFICTAVTCDMCKTNLKTIDTVSSLQESQSDTSILEVNQADIINPAIEITDVFWNPNLKIIEVSLSQFSSWGGWKMYVDGKEMSMEGGAGKPVVRPNADINNNPTGLIIGTEPWVTGLSNVDFPVCGTLQFDIPGKGLTNIYQFNLTGTGCKTASTKNCQIAVAEQEDTAQTATSSSSSSKSTGSESTKEGNQTNTATTDSNVKQGITADIRATDIYPDNQPKGIIFARITNDGPGILSGNKVTVTVSGTEKEINAAASASFITQPKEYSLKLKPGETQIINLEVDIDLSKYSYNFTITVAPVDFTDTNSNNNSYSEAVAVTQNQQQVSPIIVAADIVITDLYPSNYPVGTLCVRVTNNGPGVIENKTIAITISGSQKSPSGVQSKEFNIMNQQFYINKNGPFSTISLKPGETKAIEFGLNTITIFEVLFKYNFKLTIEAVDFIDANENNNTYTESIGSDKVLISITNNTGAEIKDIEVFIYPAGTQNKGDNLLLYRAQAYLGPGFSISNNSTIIFLVNPGLYDMELCYLAYGKRYIIEAQYGVNIIKDYNWILKDAAVVIQAPSNIPIWGFYYAPYLSLNYSSNLLKEIIPPNGTGIAKLPPGEWDWNVTTSNFDNYYWKSKKSFYGYSYLRVPEEWERNM